MKTLLIDGNSLINRAFYALPILTTDEGVYTNAVYGFLKMFYKAVDEYAPDNVVCAFDLKQPTFRHERYPEYKAGRKPMPEELVPQIPLLKDVLGQLGVKCVSVPGFEADDIIGTYSRLALEAGGESAIITGDRDSFQLINEKTSVWFTKKGISDLLKLTPENLKENYGVNANQVCDLKGLMGDSSDNIPGVPGVGEKTALSLIEKYGSVDGLYDHAQELTGKTGEKIRDGKASAFESRFLATIVTNVPVPELGECAYIPADDTVAEGIFKKYQFNSLLERVGSVKETVEFTTLPFSGLEAALASQQSPQAVGIYITEDFVSVSFDGITEYSASLSFDLLSMGVSLDYAVDILQPIVENDKTIKIFYDCKAAMHLFKQIKSIGGDVLLAEYLLDAGSSDLSLESICSRYGVSAGGASLMYIHSKQLTALQNQGMISLYRDMELPLARVLFDMEQTGFYVDAGALRALGNEFSSRISELTKEIYALAGKEFNINSTQQLGEVLFTDLGLPAAKKTKRGYSTDTDVLEGLEHPIIEPIMEYRQMQKLKSTYVDAMFGLISQRDNRIHTTFKQALVSTGRISSAEPNLQNIPVRYEAGRNIRKAFLAEKEGYVLVNADYSQIELRILAHLSGDETLINSFNRNEDIHARTAAEVFGVSLEEVTKEQRSQAKAINFGIVYGISDFGLAKSISSSRKKAAAFMQTYFQRYPRVRQYLDSVIEQAKRTGYAVTMFNRKRPIPQLRSQNYNQRSFGARVAMNAPIQGTAADIIKLAMLRVYEELEAKPELGKLILQVHDELIIEVKEEFAKDTAEMLSRVMSNAVKLSVPLTAETNIGKTWFELK